MLQQTQVSRMREFYQRFLKRFPTVKKLARSSWEDVLPYWRGLGYYNRGRNLLAAAQYVQKNCDGRLPSDEKELLLLPGVGKYTAAAISCFAYGKKRAAFDTNLRRVFSRLFGVAESEAEAVADEFFLKSKSDPALLNHAFMDLGATLCRGVKASCAACPFSRSCASAFQVESTSKQVQPVPGKKRGKKLRKGAVTFVPCIHRDGRYLLKTKQQRGKRRTFFPEIQSEPGESARHVLKKHFLEKYQIELSVRPAFLRSDVEKEVSFFRCQILADKRTRAPRGFRWVELRELDTDSLPVSQRVGVERLRKMP